MRRLSLSRVILFGALIVGLVLAVRLVIWLLPLLIIGVVVAVVLWLLARRGQL